MSDKTHTTPQRMVSSPAVATVLADSFDDQPFHSGTPFFADATLDLDEAHDIAETPEANRPKFDSTKITGTNGRVISKLNVPVLPQLSSDDAATDAHTDTTNNNNNNNNTREKKNFSRITSLETEPTTNTTTTTTTTHNKRRNNQKLPRWPRDIPWAVSFWIFCPVAFVWPILIEKHDLDVSPLVHHPLSTATLHTLWWAAVATFLLSRLLYRTAAGGDGNDQRHAAAVVLSAAAPVSVAVYTAAAAMIAVQCPTARAAALIPAWYTVRDVYLFRRWTRRSQLQGHGSRHAFFQALTGAALDILSRSLRRASFYRVLSAILAVQLAVLLLWRWALLGALGSQSWIVLIVTVVGGKWATGTVARLLSLLACGGVTSWFAQQTALLQDLAPPVTPRANGSSDQAEQDFGGSPVPEAYRTADASVYQSVLDMDEEGLDDDYELDDDEFMEAPSRREHVRREASNNPAHTSTVKSILSAGLTVSFGSVAQCGLVGGPAQFVWSQVRKVEAAQNVISQARTDGGFQGMQIGNDDTSLITKLWNRVNMVARGFVRGYSDLALTHVAAPYYKSYQKAARDIATLIDESGMLHEHVDLSLDLLPFSSFRILTISLSLLFAGVEPILHDDITTHMCSCVGGSISGIIVIFTGYVLLHQRKNATEDISDLEVVENMLLAFVISYTLIFTVMEPLRASIKAIYVSFAQHPRSLSQAFPLIYHRLSRLSSESNVVS